MRDYASGAMTFVDRYWEMIYMAAGWRSLRVWLFVCIIVARLAFTTIADRATAVMLTTGTRLQQTPQREGGSAGVAPL